MKNRIRIESHENVVTNAKIFYVPDEGDEVDISDCVQGVDLHLHVGEPSTATLRVILVDGVVSAAVEEVIVKRFNRRRFRWLSLMRERAVWNFKRWVVRSLGQHLRRELYEFERRQRRSV